MQRQDSVSHAKKSFLPLLVLSLMALAVAQNQHRRIGEIDFYGYAVLDLDRVRASLRVREGNDISDLDEAFFATNDCAKSWHHNFVDHTFLGCSPSRC